MLSLTECCVVQKKFFVFRSFFASNEIQRAIASEVLQCHARNNNNENCGAVGWNDEQVNNTLTAKSSLKLNLGISCGGDLENILPNAVAVARRAFEETSVRIANNNNNSITTGSTSKTIQLISTGPISGMSLLYGLNASMLPHYDSPTQPGQREEWLCMMSLGNTMMFRCDDEVIAIHSGDVIVMDSMTILHGVERIVPDDNIPTTCERTGFPIPQARLGILFWRGKETAALEHTVVVRPDEEVYLENTHGLFDDDSYE